MTSAPVVDERLHRDALETALTATLGANRVYDYGEVGQPLPSIFVVLGIERRFVEPRRAGRAGRSGWRVTFRYVGRSVDEARWAGLKVAAAIDEQVLTIGGVKSTPVTHESTTAIAPDDGRYSGLVVYTYVL